MPPSVLRPNTFVTRLLPWLIGAGAFMIFVVTLNRWVSLQSLGTVARVSGWLWRPQLEQPLTAIVFYPFSFLPTAWVPAALNFFTAICAAVVLMLLARSVALLPHDVTRNEPFPKKQPVTLLSIPTAWIPPLLAAILCGLQLSFWEHATSASGEMIDLLAFAYVLRCLLEFRLDQKQAWLSRAALVLGAGMANNWAMIGFFPVFLVALLRTKGYGPFRERNFLLRMTVWGLAGLSLFLLLPLLQTLSPHGQVDFWTALKAHLKSQVEFLSYLRRPRFRILALGLLLPVFVLSIRWKSHTVQFGDDTRFGIFLTKSTVNLVHGLFFVISLWIALDPTFSPRNLDLGTPLLTYYYLSALVFGYCAGYFLLFGSPPVERAQNPPVAPRWRNLRAKLELCAGLVPAAGVALVSILPLLLLWRNLAEIIKTNGPLLQHFARELYSDLPVKSVVLSDDPAELLLLQATSSARHHDKEAILLDAPALVSDQYQAIMARRFKSRWPSSTPTKAGIRPGKVLSLLFNFAAHEPLVYLHPGFGPLFERFAAQPRGSTYVLVPRMRSERPVARTPSSSDPLPQRDGLSGIERGKTRIIGEKRRQKLADDIINRNEQLWQERWAKSLQNLAGRTKLLPKYPRAPAQGIMGRLYLPHERNRTLSFVGAGYSKRLNYWGVQMQRQAHGAEARTWFQRAIELNPENLTAHINLEYAERKPAAHKPAIQNELLGQFAKYNNWREILQANGPVDEPLFLYRTGRMLLAGGNSTQAIEEFVRCIELAPDWPVPQLWLAQSCLQAGDFATALEVTDGLQTSGAPEDGPGLALLLECRATALRRLGRTNEEAACVESYVAQYAKQSEVLSVAAELFGQIGRFGQQLKLLDELLKRDPKRLELLFRKGLAQMDLAQYDAAILTLNAVLSVAARNENARLCRAVAYLGLGELEGARADYQELLRIAENPRNALFGLGTVAWRQGETNLAISYYEQYLSNHLLETHQDTLAAERLAQLRAPKSK